MIWDYDIFKIRWGLIIFVALSPVSAFGSYNLEFHDTDRLTNIHDKHGNNVMNYCTILWSKTAEGF